MRGLLRASVRSRVLVLSLSVALLVVGFIQLRNMPRSVLPEFRPPTVEVQTEALGLSAEEVERLITIPLEQEILNGVAYIDFIRSESVPGLSRIEMIFEPGTPTKRARQVVNERLTQVKQSVPEVSNVPQMLQPVSSESRLMLIGLSSKDRSLTDLSVLAKWTLRPRLMGVPGVSNVAVWGNREHQLQVQIDPARLQANRVTLDQVIRSTGNSLWFSPLTFLEASTPGTGGFLETENQRIGVQHAQPIKTADDLSQVAIEGGQGKRLGDVATVVEDHQPLIGDAAFPSDTGLLLVVEKLPEANTLEVTRNIEKALDDMAPGLTGVEVDTSLFQPARYIEESGHNFGLALLIGFVLLAVALFLFLRRLRIVAVALASVLLSMAAAVVVLSLRGETLNVMVLAGLALALVILVDDAVMSADTVRARLGRVDSDERPHLRVRTYIDSLIETRGVLLYAVAIVLLSLVPIAVLGGEAGAFLPPAALSYAGAVVASFFVSLTATPALAVFLQSKQPLEREVPSLVQRATVRYEPALSRTLGRPKRVRLLVGALAVLTIALVPFMDRGSRSLVPALKDRDLLIQWNGTPGTSLTEMRRIASRASAELKDLRGVEKVSGHVGRAITGDQVVGANSGALWVSIRPSADYEGTVRSIERVVKGYPGIEDSVLTFSGQQVDDMLRNPAGVPGKDLTVRVFGYDYPLLKSQAEAVAAKLAKVGGLEDIAVALPVQEPTLEVVVDLDAAEEAGLKPGDIRRAAATYLSGVRAGDLFEDQKVFEVVVLGTPDTHSSVDRVKQLLIDVGDGSRIPLSDVAEVRIAPNPNVIRHEDVSRYIDVGMNVKGISRAAAARDVQGTVRGMQFPNEYHAEVLGTFKDSRSQSLQFIGVLVAAAVAVFLLLQSAFGSWRLAAAGFVALIAALFGCMLAIVLDRDAVSIGSLAGILGIVALAARHALVFVRRCHDFEGDDESPIDADVVGAVARERVAPTITTAAALALVFLPFVFFGDRAGLEVVRPMAVVVLGGLITTTLVDLFVVPAHYLKFGFRPKEARERFDMGLDLHDEIDVPTAVHA